VAASLKKHLVCAFVLLLAVTVRAETWQGTCTGVLDGDSLLVSGGRGKKEVRLYGVDAPEFDQAYGRQARACLRTLVLKKTVTIEPLDMDTYGRTIAKVYREGDCVNERLIADGCARVYTRFCKPEDREAWSVLEHNARQQRSGLWSQDNPVAPWDFRRTKWRAEPKQAKATVPVSGYYRGNTGSRVFHAPGCSYAGCKRCTAGFNSIGEALRAGYTPCKQCIDN
jgi:endonuclease YncB( thermonuclease family)